MVIKQRTVICKQVVSDKKNTFLSTTTTRLEKLKPSKAKAKSDEDDYRWGCVLHSIKFNSNNMATEASQMRRSMSHNNL